MATNLFVAKNRQSFRTKLEQRVPTSAGRFAQLFSGGGGILSNRWTLWRFDCRDFPQHNCAAKLECPFCIEVNKLQMFSKNTVNESLLRWDTYLKRDKSFDDAQALLRVLTDAFLPSKLAKSVFFNRKLGVAIFREDIPPKFESAQNIAGGIFQLQLVATSGHQSAATVQKIDALFAQSLRLLFGLPAPISCHVYGMFYRCELFKGSRAEVPLSYGNLLDLPFLAKFEIWIDDIDHEQLVKTALIDQIKNLVKALEMPIHQSFRLNRNNLRAEKFAKMEKPYIKNKK